MVAGRLPAALLEEWMRDYYFEAEIDIGSSGVEDYSLHELRRLLGISCEELDAVVLHDSRTLGDPELRAAIGRRWTGGDTHRVMVTHERDRTATGSAGHPDVRRASQEDAT